MLNELEHAAKVVGVKQVRRALAGGRAGRVYLAKDADPQLIRPLKLLAEERGVEVVQAGSMKALGRACGITVGTACAAVVSSADGAEREQKSKAR
ncbi:MAG: 50S ribosomal protein L7ae-like protein [Oscillospiraceae bacterium]|jgi:large subunit ribosomal protein L7A|nr:50S ribosomal protein L7ae-like protein [Oscillospiraceae bacterium]